MPEQQACDIQVGRRSTGSAQMEPSVFIVVLNWNGRADTLTCLRSLQALADKRTRVLVVDNGSTDGSVAAILAAHPEVPVIETGRNLGYAGGNNVGVRHAIAEGADFVLVLNNDTVCAPDMIDRLLQAAAKHPGAGMFCPRIFYMHDPGRVWFDGPVGTRPSSTSAFPAKTGWSPNCPPTNARSITPAERRCSFARKSSGRLARSMSAISSSGRRRTGVSGRGRRAGRAW